jgi:hypothetical protein
LLGLRELEQADLALPNIVDGIRRTLLITHDPISTTWEGWHMGSGKRVRIRALRPRWRRDPIWLRRFNRTADMVTEIPSLTPVRWRPEGDWPHLLVEVPGATLADHLPVEDPADSGRLAAFLGAGLIALDDLHNCGLVHGHISPMSLVWGPNGARVIWLDPLLMDAGPPQQDLAALGRAVGQLDPDCMNPLGAMAHSLAELPPPTTALAELLLRRAMATALADRRHHLAVQARSVARRGAHARLLRATRSLAAALQPPSGVFCLRAGHDPVLIIAKSDGRSVRGGPTGGVPAEFLPLVWSPETGLDAPAARVLLRAWATRTRGDEERRAAVQRQNNATDEKASALCRWISGEARLRALRMLMELGA